MKELFFKKITNRVGVGVTLSDKDDCLWYMDDKDGVRHFMFFNVMVAHYPNSPYRSLQIIIWPLNVMFGWIRRAKR